MTKPSKLTAAGPWEGDQYPGMSRPRLRLVMVLIFLLLFSGLAAFGARVSHRLRNAGSAPSCAENVALVVVATDHRLWTCHDGKPVRSFPVRLGWGGVNKQREGDRRTPLGLYPLGEPRPSSRFGTFIPIGYPTSEQRARGLTGSAVGVHGTRSLLSWMGDLTTVLDTTDGCVAVGSAEAIASIAEAVRLQPNPLIDLR